ncbi:MAG: lamin tail domain-containing protein [Planctomycetes bacterium]|nr:lamin tail domain-containing protein [Planctomycetota bacterium]
MRFYGRDIGRIFSWSILLLAALPVYLALAAPLFGLTITEIHYAPPGPAAEAARLKFVEIFNDSPTVVDLTGHRFSAGIRFAFPDRILLDGRAYLVIAADQEEIKKRYGLQNVIGDFSGNLSEDGDQVVLVNEGGVPVAQVAYRDSEKWTSVPAGTGYTLSLRSPYADVRRPENWTSSARIGGSPGTANFPPPQPSDAEIFGESSVWKFKRGWDGAAIPAAFSEPPEAWTRSDFDDAAWEEGATGIGFGDATVLTELSDMKDNYVSFACRKKFTIHEDIYNDVEGLILRIKVDDGFIATLNGVEIGRFNMGVAGTNFTPEAVARGASEANNAIEIAVSKDKYHAGDNVLAVEVHNISKASNDANFIPSLVSRKFISFDPAPLPPVRLNEVYAYLGSSPRERFVELANVSSQPLDISGFFLTDDPGQLEKFMIPDGTVLSPRGWMVFSEEATGLHLDLSRVKVFLGAADGKTIADAAIFKNSKTAGSSPLSHVRSPDGGGTWRITPIITPGAANQVAVEQDIVLNEIMYDSPASPERGEFIELYNRGSRAISLAGWKIVEGFNFSFPASTWIKPGEYLVVARDPQFIRDTYQLPAEQVLGPGQEAESLDRFGRLSNDGEDVRAVDELGNTVIEVRYSSGGEWTELADGGGSSLELLDPWQDASFPSAWQASDQTQTAPWTEYGYQAINTTGGESEVWFLLHSDGEVLVDDISVTDSGGKEYVNLAGNPPVYAGGFDADTKPWRFEGNHVSSSRHTAEAHSGPACLKIVAAGPGDNKYNKVEMDTSPRLPAGQVTVKFWARWLKGARLLHTCGWSNTFARTQVLNVPAALGTPGRENSARTGLREATGDVNLGPVITSVSHSPSVPGAGDEVQVRARLSDSDGVESARVGAFIGKRGPTTQWIPLADDGLSGDGAAGDGIYGGKIPAQALNTKVLFFVEASDRRGAVRTFPTNAPVKTLLYQVSAAYASTTFRYRLILDDDNLRTLTVQRLHSDNQVDGAFVFEESEVYYNVGVRYHGSPWNRPPDPKMFRIHFNADKKLGGFAKINASRYGNAHNEGTAYHLIRRASAGETARTPYTPRYNYTRMYYNGKLHGSMAEITAVNSDYVDFWWPNDSNGSAFKITGKLDFSDAGTHTGTNWTQFRYYGNDKEAFRYFYNLGAGRSEDNFEPLMEFLKVMDARMTPNNQFPEKLESILNLESFLRVLAIRCLQDDWDTIGIGNGQNAYLYYAPIEGRFYLLPWDLDHTFSNTGATLLPTGDPGTSRILQIPKFKRAYLRIVKEFVDTFWNPGPDGIGPYLDKVAAVTSKSGVGPPSQIKSFMTARLTSARNLVKSTQTVPFAITTNGGADFASDLEVEKLQGTAPLELYQMILNGRLVEPQWSGAIFTGWTLDVPLPAENNDFELIGYDRDGNLVGNVLHIRITRIPGCARPAVIGVNPPTGSAAGGLEVTIAGSGFGAGARVFFGAQEAARVSFVSVQELRANVPPDAAPALDGHAVDVKVANAPGCEGVLWAGFTYEGAAPRFIRGDADGRGQVDAADALAILQFLFLKGELRCQDGADVDDSGKLSLGDPIRLLIHLYRGGSPPPAPYPEAGEDPTADGLGCN